MGVRRAIAVVSAAAALASVAVVPAVRASDEPGVPTPTVTGPIGNAGIRGHLFNQSVVPLPKYREDEFFFGGTARALTVPGKAPAAYESRLYVRRPADTTDFNGVVYVEWLNVTAQQDLDQHWAPTYQMLMREGAAYVGVSAQQAGVLHLKAWDPVRYASLSHPGDDYSFDIFAQAMKAIRDGGATGPMAGSKVTTVIATGHSQSGIRLHTYVDRVQNLTRVADGFFLSGQSDPVFDVDNLRVPVIAYMSDAEISNRTPIPSPWLRVWHVAGTAHNDHWYATYLADELAHDYANSPRPVAFDVRRSGDYGQELNPFAAPPGVIPTLACPNPNADEMPDRYAISAAFHHLARWAAPGSPGYGERVPATALAHFDAAGNVIRDRYGNVTGGLRLPPIDVPVATYVACGVVLSATWVFDPATLQSLYPTRAQYVAEMQAATDRAVAAGYLLPEDAADLMSRAHQAFLGVLPA